MRLYSDDCDTLITQLKKYENFEDKKFFTPNSRLTKHHGHTYIKVAEFYHSVSPLLSIALALGSYLTTICTLGLALFSKDIRLALCGVTCKSFYSEVNDNLNTTRKVAQRKLFPEQSYQDELRDRTIASYQILYKDKTLVSMLSEEKNQEKAFEDGREKLSALAAEAIIPFACYVQLKEIENEINYPIFKNPRVYTNRHQLLLQAKQELDQLDPQEKKILTEMLLKGGQFDIRTQNLSPSRSNLLNLLYKDISELAGQLYQGNKVFTNALAEATDLVNGLG